MVSLISLSLPRLGPSGKEERMAVCVSPITPSKGSDRFGRSRIVADSLKPGGSKTSWTFLLQCFEEAASARHPSRKERVRVLAGPSFEKESDSSKSEGLGRRANHLSPCE